MDRTAPLLIEYAKRSGSPAELAIDAIFRTTPFRRSFIVGSVADRQLYMPFTFTR